MLAFLQDMPLVVQIFLCYAAAHFGILVHYLKKAARRETDSSFVQFFFSNNWQATALSYFSCMGAVTALLLESNAVSQLILPSFAAGVAFNSLLNKESQ